MSYTSIAFKTTLYQFITMNNLLYLPNTASVALHHRTTQTVPAQALTASFTAGSKFRIILDRLQDPSASYNRLINPSSMVDKAIAVFVVFHIVTITDHTKLIEAEMQLEHDQAVQHRLDAETLNNSISSCTNTHLNAACIQAYVIIWITIALVLVEYGDLVAACVALPALAELVSVESRELSFHNLFASSGPLRGSSLTMFDASKTEDGFDCVICQEVIGEAEWIYPIPCQHQFHR